MPIYAVRFNEFCEELGLRNAPTALIYATSKKAVEKLFKKKQNQPFIKWSGKQKEKSFPAQSILLSVRKIKINIKDSTTLLWITPHCPVDVTGLKSQEGIKRLQQSEAVTPSSELELELGDDLDREIREHEFPRLTYWMEIADDEKIHGQSTDPCSSEYKETVALGIEDELERTAASK